MIYLLTRRGRDVVAQIVIDHKIKNIEKSKMKIKDIH